MNCWKCAKTLGEEAKKIGFRTVCPNCGIDLHTCTNCKYYTLGKPNDCAVPGTDYVRDREANNFCEDFKIKAKTEPPKKSNFNSLFKDEP
jgi:hypothetical protein